MAQPSAASSHLLVMRTTRMNALASDLIRQTEELSESVTRPIPGSTKIYVIGSRAEAP